MAMVASAASWGLADTQLLGMGYHRLGLMVGRLLLARGFCLLLVAVFLVLPTGILLLIKGVVLSVTNILLLASSTLYSRPVGGPCMLLVRVDAGTRHEKSTTQLETEREGTQALISQEDLV